jgi:hypothetical protein
MATKQTKRKEKRDAQDEPRSVSPTGESFLLPRPEEYEKELTRLKTLLAAQRKKKREIVVVMGVGFVGAVMAGIVADAVDKTTGRLDTLQAAIILAKFAIFPEEVQLRQEVASRYTALLDGALVRPPHIPPNNLSAWAQYSVLAKDEAHRAALLKRLQEAKIPAAIYYPKPLHLQTAFAFLGYAPGVFPVSEDAAKRIFSLPMHPYLTEQDQIKIAETIKG